MELVTSIAGSKAAGDGTALSIALGLQGSDLTNVLLPAPLGPTMAVVPVEKV